MRATKVLAPDRAYGQPGQRFIPWFMLHTFTRFHVIDEADVPVPLSGIPSARVVERISAGISDLVLSQAELLFQDPHRCVIGVFPLLQVCRRKPPGGVLFLHVLL